MNEELTKEIINQLLEQGYYEETVEVLPGLNVTFKTRTHAEEFEVRTAFNKAGINPTNMIDYTFFNIHYALPHSVKQIGNTPIEGSYEDKTKILERLPQPIYVAIVNAFQKFEKKVMEATGVDFLKK